MPGGTWFSSGGSSGGGRLAPAPVDTYDPYAALSRGGGNPAFLGPGDDAVKKRKFAQVGKINLNLLDPLAAQREAADLVPIDEPPEGPLGGIARYYSPSTPGGFFAGIAGAIGQTVGGVFGEGGAKAGAEAGAILGKTIEAPLGIAGGLGVESLPFVAPVIDQANSAIEENSPYILRDTLKIPKNLGGAFQSLLNAMGIVGRAVERTYAGMQSLRGALPEDIQARIDAGEITREQALDELVMQGRGFTNDPLHNMVYSILTDPVNWASLGVGAVAGAARGTVAVSRVFSSAAMREGSAVARLASEPGELGNLVRAAQAGTDITKTSMSRGALGEMRRLVNEDLLDRVADGEDIPNHLKLALTERLGMSALGPVTESATENLVYRTANAIARATDPGNFFSGSKAGKRSMEQLHMASATGVMAALKPSVVRELQSIGDDIASDGSDRVLEGIGTWGANAMQEVSVHEMANAIAQEGSIPRIGSFNPTEVNRQVLAGGAYDTNIGKYVEIHIEKTKDIRVASLPTRQMYDETVNKLAAIFGVDPGKVQARVKSVNADMAMAVHGLYYYTKGKVLHTEVVTALGEMRNQGTLLKGLDPDNITMVTPRTLTDKRVAALDTAVKAADIGLVRAITENFDDFNWMNSSTVPDGEVVDAVREWLDANRSYLPKEIELIDPVTGTWYQGLGPELEAWAEDSQKFGYGLASGMPRDAPLEAQFRITKKSNGTIRNANPWLNFWAEGIPDAKRLGRLESMRMAMTRGIRGERILWNQRRRFITDMASDEAGNIPIPPALADRLFRSLMREAQMGNVMPRGMAPDQMMTTVNGVLRDARNHSSQWAGLAGRLTERQVLMSFLRAMEGDISMVGATQKVTGRIKSAAPGSGANYWGQLSEKLYPLMRFTLNPVFMAMELTEPYILGVMRGQWLPLRRSQPRFQQGLASHNAARQVTFSSTDPDGLMAESAEMFSLRLYGVQTAREQFGPRTIWGRLRGARPAIAQRKNAAAGLQARKLIGDNLYRAFKAVKGDDFNRFWGDIEYRFGTVDRAEIGDRWIAEDLALMDNDGHRVTLSMDLMNPTNLGQRLRLSTDGSRPGDYTFADVERLLDDVEIERASGSTTGTRAERGLPPGEALLEDLRSMSAADWADEVERAGKTPRTGRISDSNADQIWRLANGPEVKAFWKDYRDTFLRNVKGPTAVATRKLRDAEIAATRALLKAFAEGKNLTEEEFIKLHFDELPQWAVDAGVLPPQVLTDIRGHFSRAIFTRGPGVSAYSSRLIQWADEANLEDAAHPIQRTVAEIREGSENRGYLYVPTTMQALGRAKDSMQAGYGSGLLAAKYSKAGTDPIRAMTHYPGEALVRIKASEVPATRENASNLKRPKSHDMLLDEDVDVFTSWPKLEVYTEAGWRGWQDFVTSDRVPPPQMREGFVEEPWLGHLFGMTGDETAPYAVDFKALLTPDEFQATQDYKGVIYGPMNCYARGVPLDPDFPGALAMTDHRLQGLQDSLDASIRKGVLRERKPLYRGVNLSRAKADWGHDIDEMYDLQVGETLTDPGFVSTSDSFDTAYEFAVGGGHKYAPGPETKNVVLEYDLPPGFNMNVIEGGEGEHVLGRNIPFEVIERRDVYTGANDQHHSIRLKVRPIGEADAGGVTRLMLGDPPVAQRNYAMARRLAASDPDELRRLAANTDENVREGITDVVEQLIARATTSQPREFVTHGVALRVGEIGGRKFGRIGSDEVLDDVIEQIDENDVPSYITAWADTRGRVEDLSVTRGGVDEQGYPFSGDPDEDAGFVLADMDARMLAGMAAAMPEKGGRNAITSFLATLEKVWQGGPAAVREADATSLLQAQHLLRGIKHPFDSPNLPPEVNDALDVLLGNTSRRHTGRTDLAQPIVADDAAYEAAGFLTQGTIDDLKAAGHDVTGLVAELKSEQTHEYLVQFYNDMARGANDRALGGWTEWTAADMALMAGRSRQVQGRAWEELPGEAIESNIRTVLAEVYFPLGSDGEWLNPVLDLLNRPDNWGARHDFMRAVQTNLLQDLRDELGLIVDEFDVQGIGIWDRNNPQSMVPLHILATPGRGDELADILAYTMLQQEVWHFTVADNAIAEAAGWAGYDPRVSFTFEGMHAKADAREVAAKLGQQYPAAKGATATARSDGSWQISIIDREGLLPRLDSGAVDEEKALAMFEETSQGIGEELGAVMHVDYGTTYVGGPAKKADGTVDWEGHRDAVEASLTARGASADINQLDRLRSTYQQQVEYSIEQAAPQNTARARRREPVTNTLEDKRGGQVFGTTTPTGVNSAVIRGFGAADPITGVHELIHVFSIAGMDSSLRDAVTKAWEEHAINIDVAATALEARAAAHTNRSAATQLRNRANAMRAGIQNPHPGAWGKAQEEFFADLVLKWIGNGTVPSPELGNAFEHFRNWLQLTKRSRATNGLPEIVVSPQMDARLKRMFSRPGIETVPYSIETETIRQTLRQVVRNSWDEAHSTQFYKRDRSMIERSINHPYIGLYPASYMWGKVLPEMIRFLALRPFGMTTPFLGLNVAREVGDTVRMQSETDESFKKFLEENEDAFMFLSMFFPALPHDIPGNASLPLRRVAEQGLENQAAYAAGATEVDDIEFARGAQDALQYAVGPLGTIRTVGDIAGMTGEFAGTALGLETEEEETRALLPLR